MKKFAILFGIVFAAPVFANPCIDQLKTPLFAVHSAAVAADMWTTSRCLHRNTCQENGPGLVKLFGHHPNDKQLALAGVLNEGLYLGGSCGLGAVFGYDSPALPIFQITVTGAHGIAAGLNLRF